MDIVKFNKANLSYRNTPDPVTKVPPAIAVFGRDIRDGLSVLTSKYNPHAYWQELL